MLNALKLQMHWIFFVHVTWQMILTFVKLSEQYTVNNNQIVIDLKMIFDLKWKAIEHNKKISVIEMTIKNWLSLMNADLILMIQ